MSVFSVPFMRTALAASLLGGNVLAVLGLFVLMRRVSFAGLAVSQLAALGSVVGVLVGWASLEEGHSVSFLFPFLFILAGLIFVAIANRSRRVPNESWIGMLYVAGAAFAVLILAKAPWGEAHTLNIFFGNVLTLGATEVWEAAALAALTIAIIVLWFSRWVWLAFDSQSAEISGIPLQRWQVYFYALLGLNMAVTIHLFGVLLAFAYLLLPATASLILSRKINSLLIYSPFITTAVTVIGFSCSFHFDLPTGPFIASLLVVVTLAAAVYGKFSNRIG